VGLGLPPVVCVAWCAWAFRTSPGTVAGEILLAPALCWMTFVGPSAWCGLCALNAVRQAGGRFRGRWLAFAGLILAAAPPALGLVAITRLAVIRP